MTHGAPTNKSRDTTLLNVFKAGNLYSKHVGPLYVVYSYRWDWPIYVHHPEHGWFANADKAYSVTTARHMRQARPSSEEMQSMTRAEMIEFINYHREETTHET